MRLRYQEKRRSVGMSMKALMHVKMRKAFQLNLAGIYIYVKGVGTC